MATPSISAQPPGKGAAPDLADAGRAMRRRRLIAYGFLLPAGVLLTVWIMYPTIYTVVRSLYDQGGAHFVGLHNYKTLFTTSILVTAIKNNAIWVLVVPALVTAIGLVFAVLTERVRWSVAFKTAIFMPMAISLFAAGVIWHIMYTQDPSHGTVNAALRAVDSVFSPPGVLSGAAPSNNALSGSTSSGFTLRTPLHPGQVADMGLTGISPTEIPKNATQAVQPTAQPGAITGVVWRDFKPGGGTPGKIDQGELGLPGTTVELVNQSGSTVTSVKAQPSGDFVFSKVAPGAYHVRIGAATFRPAYGGVSWLGSSLITPSIIIAYIWVWAGFSMVVIGAGLAAIPRDVLEAARTDGASEWQVFRRVTVPLLAPVLSVVFITMIINVLKVFDIILSIAPGSSESSANVIALAMWRTSFGGINDFGLGSAIAVFLFILVVPVLLLNIRRFKREV
jgi:alpha-glucoside transport system permease protein